MLARYDLAVIDSAPSLGLLTVGALVAADAVLILTPTLGAGPPRAGFIPAPPQGDAGPQPHAGDPGCADHQV